MSTQTTRLNRHDLFALGLILLTALAFVWPLFVPGWIIPQGGGDLVSFLWPTYRYAAQTLHQIINNQTPLTALLWNPNLYSGAPFAADNQSGLFYPPNLILFGLFPDFPYRALEALVALHLFLAGAGMYLLMRWELRQLDSWKLEFGLVPALAFMASDVFITHLGNYNIVAVSAYLPAIFLFLRQMVNFQSNLRNLKLAIITGLLFGLAALAGHAQMTLILALACGLYGAYELALQRDWRILVLGLLTAVVAFGLAAVALLPALEMLEYTARSALSYPEAARWSLPPLGLAGMLSPLVFGRGARDFWPAWDRVEFGYMGIVTVILCLQLRKFKGWPFGIWLLGLGAFGLVVALGSYTPVHFLLFKLVPGFASLRVPARFILLTNFALAILSGFALAVRSEHSGLKSTGVVLLGLGAFVLFAPLALDHPPAWLALISVAIFSALALLLLRFRPAWLALLLFGELFIFGALVEVDRADPNAGYQRGPAVDWLLAQPGPTRIDVASGPWQPDAPAVFGLESITGIANPLALGYYDRYYWSVGYRGSPQYNFLNAQFVVAAKDSPPADSTFIPVFNEDPEVDVYLNTNAMPRVHLIYEAIFVADNQAAFNAVHDPAFNPAAQVVLESPPIRLPSPTPLLNPPEPNLFYTDYGPGRFTVVSQAPIPAYVSLAEVWYPGWAVTVNGQPSQFFRANSAFLAVPVPPGESTIDFHFTSPWLAVGALLTGLTLLLSLAFFAGQRIFAGRFGHNL